MLVQWTRPFSLSIMRTLKDSKKRGEPSVAGQATD